MNALTLRVFVCVGAHCVTCCLVRQVSSSCTSSACGLAFWTTSCLCFTMPAFLYSLFIFICFIVIASPYGHVIARFMRPSTWDFVWGVLLDVVELAHEFVADRLARCVSIFFSFLLLMMFFRANAMFAYLTDKVLRGLNNAKFAGLQNAMTQVALVTVEILLLGIMMQWLDQVVSVLFFFLEVFTDCVSCSRSL